MEITDRIYITGQTQKWWVCEITCLSCHGATAGTGGLRKGVSSLTASLWPSTNKQPVTFISPKPHLTRRTQVCELHLYSWAPGWAWPAWRAVGTCECVSEICLRSLRTHQHVKSQKSHFTCRDVVFLSVFGHTRTCVCGHRREWSVLLYMCWGEGLEVRRKVRGPGFCQTLQLSAHMVQAAPERSYKATELQSSLKEDSLEVTKFGRSETGLQDRRREEGGGRNITLCANTFTPIIKQTVRLW